MLLVKQSKGSREEDWSSAAGLSVCLSVCLEVGVNLRLKNDHWLPMMHNREGLESTKQQTVWWSTKMCSSGAH